MLLRDLLPRFVPAVVVLLVIAGLTTAIAFSFTFDPARRTQTLLGVFVGQMIVFEFLLLVRKRLRAWRIGSARTWMTAHIWLGFLSVPPVVMHTHFSLGDPTAAVTLLLFFAVVASGVVGLCMQQIIPRRLLEDVPGETIFSEIEYVSELSLRDAEELIVFACGPDPTRKCFTTDEPTRSGAIRKFRQVGVVHGSSLQSRVITGTLANGDLLRDEFYSEIAPYIAQGRRAKSRLAGFHQAGQYFDRLSKTIGPEGSELVESLRTLCDQRRQLDVQSRYHWWLHGWTLVHTPLSIALVLFMLAHAYMVLRYT